MVSTNSAAFTLPLAMSYSDTGNRRTRGGTSLPMCGGPFSRMTSRSSKAATATLLGRPSLRCRASWRFSGRVGSFGFNTQTVKVPLVCASDLIRHSCPAASPRNPNVITPLSNAEQITRSTRHPASRERLEANSESKSHSTKHCVRPSVSIRPNPSGRNTAISYTGPRL